MAADRNKDQSYFLFPVTPVALGSTIFPLGGLTKPEVRAEAERMGLVTAQKPESQEICFIPDDDHAGFVSRQRPDLDGAGDIVDEAGVAGPERDGRRAAVERARAEVDVVVGPEARAREDHVPGVERGRGDVPLFRRGVPGVREAHAAAGRGPCAKLRRERGSGAKEEPRDD
jgi:hypothetical protein